MSRTANRWAWAVVPLLFYGCATVPDQPVASPDLTAQCAGSTGPANAPDLPYSAAQKVSGGTTVTCLVEGGTARLSVMPGEGTSSDLADAIAADRPLPAECSVQSEVQAFVLIDGIWYRARNAVCSGDSGT